MSMEMLMNVFDLINQIILFILAISTLIGILDFVGFLPGNLRKFLQLNRSDDMIETLKKLGVDVEKQNRLNEYIKYPKDSSKESIEKVTYDMINKFKINENIAIGHYRTKELKYYIDLMGATCEPQYAVYFARLLSTYWSDTIINTNNVKNCKFDFVVTPKGGSSMLGYEFAKLIEKPFVLHEESERFQNRPDDFRAFFNCSKIPQHGETALIVDDSTTGGKMVLDTINHLKQFKYEVNICLVVFEPRIKDAKQKLAQNDVQLVSIVKTHEI